MFSVHSSESFFQNLIVFVSFFIKTDLSFTPQQPEDTAEFLVLTMLIIFTRIIIASDVHWMLAMHFAPVRALTWLFSLRSHHPKVQLRKPQHLSPSPVGQPATWGRRALQGWFGLCPPPRGPFWQIMPFGWPLSSVWAKECLTLIRLCKRWTYSFLQA